MTRPDPGGTDAMLRTRLVVGTLLVLLGLGVLVADNYLAPWCPFLFVSAAVMLGLAGYELVRLLPAGTRPRAWLVLAGLGMVLLANWLPACGHNAWPAVGGALVLVLIAAFVVEMSRYAKPGSSVARVALTVFAVGYLGGLASFLLQLRWLGEGGGPLSHSALALALAIFGPKGCDIGAYAAGRMFGRHKMTPVLSPGKTWEGAAGGLMVAVLVAVGLHAAGLPVWGGIVGAAALGLSVGVAGIIGDLAESLIKRDCDRKDASRLVPGFGGVLDVIDSLLFAAPVAYWWLSR